jgi:hypothetical protein
MRTLRRTLVLGLLALACAAVPAGASNTQTYEDSTGENPAAPDITTIVVSNDDAGMLTFQVNIPNRPQLTRDMLVDMLVDTDANPATGDPDSLGADYALELFLGEVALFKWDGTGFTRRVGDPPATSLIYQYTNGVTFKISAAELGNTKKLGFAVIALSGVIVDEATGNVDFSTAVGDAAPAASAGLYSYEVKVAPAKLVLKNLATTPAQPKAGKAYTVRMSATRSDTGATITGGTVTCTAKAGSKTLKAASAKFVGGQAVCVFRIPASAKGQTLRGTITITFEGRKLTRPFSGKIA